MTQISRPGAFEFALIGLTVLIWGTAFAAIKISVLDIGAMWTATGRVVIGFIALVPVCFITGIQFPRTMRIWLLITAVAILNMVVPFLMISWSMNHIESGIGALLLGTTPIIAMILGHFFTKDEQINRYRLLAVVLGVSGVALVVGQDALSGIGASALLAQIAIIASGTCYVCAGIIMRRIDIKPIPFTTLALGIGSALLLILTFVFEGMPKTPGDNTWIALIWLGLLPTGLAYVLRFYLVRKVGIATFSVGMNSVPVFGIIAGAVLLNETIEAITIIALALVICGLFVARIATPALQSKTDTERSGS